MSLTARVSLFFLATLGFILAGYSLIFYSVSREHITAQFDVELNDVLHALVAAVEVEETEVKWQPLEHSINYGRHDEFGEVQWVVIGDSDQIVERSKPPANFAAKEIDLDRWRDSVQLGNGQLVETEDGWAVAGEQLRAPKPDGFERESDEFDQLTVLVARSTAPRDGILVRLTLLVTLLPLLAWIGAALAGRSVVRRALRPVADMANQARTISGNDFHARLMHNTSGDELSALAESFNRLLDRQKVAFEQQRRFTGDAAHELRTPLTVLLGQIDVTLRRPRSEAEYRSTMESLRKQTVTLQDIVESLLLLARRDEDSQPPTLTLISLEEWMREHAKQWESYPRGKDLRLDMQLEPDTKIRGTPVLLSRVLDNLVQNAFKYSEVGSEVIVRARQSQESVFVEVHDSGHGIPAVDLPRLFDPFFRSSEARQRGIAGTGLGLAIAKRIAETMGGDLTCTSEVGKGSCFAIQLPLGKEFSS